MQDKRNVGLDLARALAVTMVFCSHAFRPLHALGSGVDLFFLLSGFLVGRIYLRSQQDAHMVSGTFTLWGFWKARWFRTIPPYLAALGLYAISCRFTGDNGVTAPYLLFVQNYSGMDGFLVSWSLCVEEHFYLALPLACALVFRVWSRQALLWILPLLALIPQGLRSTYMLLGYYPERWFWQTHLHCEGLILGVWLSYVFVDRPQLWKTLRLPSIFVAAIPVLVMLYQLRRGNHAAALGSSTYLLYAFGFAGWLRLFYELRWRPEVRFGRVCKQAVQGAAMSAYSIYLVHTLFMKDASLLLKRWFNLAAPATHVPFQVAIITLALSLSIVFYFLVERPAIRLRDRAFRRSRELRESIPDGV